MYKTDEQILKAYMDANGNHTQAGKTLGISREAMNMRIRRLSYAGVKIPKGAHGNSGKSPLNAQRVQELNNFIESYASKTD